MSPSTPDADRSDSGRSRRSLLAAAGSLVTVATAGCISTTRDGRDRDRQSIDPAEGPGFVRHETDDAYELDFRWTAAGRRRQVRTPVEQSTYREARAAPRSFGRAFRDALSSPVAAALAGGLDEAMADLEEPVERLEAITAFVQQRDYQSDLAATGEVEYPKYVPETLVENGGDCEDLSFLLAGVLAALPTAYDPVLVFWADHVGVGIPAVRLDGGPAALADGIVAAGDRSYLFLETTADLPVGRLPHGYGKQDVLAVFDGGWPYVDLAALGREARQALASGRLVDPRAYV